MLDDSCRRRSHSQSSAEGLRSRKKGYELKTSRPDLRLAENILSLHKKYGLAVFHGPQTMFGGFAFLLLRRYIDEVGWYIIPPLFLQDSFSRRQLAWSYTWSNASFGGKVLSLGRGMMAFFFFFFASVFQHSSVAPEQRLKLHSLAPLSMEKSPVGRTTSYGVMGCP